jgi:hypothetical protein
MVQRQIILDEKTDRILSELAESYEGNASEAIAGLLLARGDHESLLEQSEALHHDSILAQLERSEQDFREGRIITLEEIKRRHGM